MQLGSLIDITDPTVDGVFPLLPDFDVDRTIGFDYVINRISLKKEQRILTKHGLNSWSVSSKRIKQPQLANFYSFYADHRLPSQLFYFYDPYEAQGLLQDGSQATGRYICRFKEDDLNFDALLDRLFTGTLEILEVNISTTPVQCPAFWTFTTDRYPTDFDGGIHVIEFFNKADFTEDNDLVPLIYLAPQISEANAIKVSDRLAFGDQTFGTTPTGLAGTYLPRLLSWDITQEIGSGDSGTFVMDDADLAFSEYAKQINLERASLRLFLYKNNTHGQWFLNLWRGFVADWQSSRADGTFTLTCEGGLHALKNSMPRRLASTICPLEFNDGQECPYTTQGSGGDPDVCDKGLDTTNGCNAHGMTRYFQGLAPKPQSATGLLPRESRFSLGRKAYSTTSTPIKSVQGEAIPLVYGNGRQIVEAKLFETRDESEFFVGSGFFSEGPVGEVGQVLLDGQTMHPGYSPIVALGALGQDIGTIIDTDFRSSRTAFVSLRRVDEVGLQNPNDNHAMLVEVLNGLPGYQIWWWTGPFSLSGAYDSSNPAEIALDLVVRALGLRLLPQTNSDNLKDNVVEIDRFIEAQDFCNELVSALVGGGTEKRYEFRGALRDQKPAIDHLRDILATAPIDLVYSFGKLAFKVRKDDITTPPSYQVTFEHNGNIIQNSFRSHRIDAQFNELKILFSDITSDFQENSVTVYDLGHQKRSGFYDPAISGNRPLVRQAQRTAIGMFTKSQVVRLGTQLLREELGGETEAEQINARNVELSASILGLAVELGDVSKVQHPDLPGGEAYVRWNYWHFSSDWRVDLRGRTVVPSMYDPSNLPQLPGSNPGPTVPGVPGGSQGSDGSENNLAALTAPVLNLISENYVGAVIGVTDRPALTNFLVVEEAAADTFSPVTNTRILPAQGLSSFPVAGTSDVHTFVRGRWRRTTDPLEESANSNIIDCSFPGITGADVTLKKPGGWIFVVFGAPAVANDVTFIITAEYDGVLTDWVMLFKSGSPAIGADTIVDIKKNGASIFDTLPVMPDGDEEAVGTGITAPGTFVKGDKFRLDVTQIGSGFAGERLQIQLNYLADLAS